MVKSINNLSGKSARHQEHELKYALSHKMATLENWFKKITTPKPVKVKHASKNAGTPQVRRIGRDPVKVEAKRQRDIERAKEYYRLNPHKWEMKQMAKDDINIK